MMMTQLLFLQIRA